ncbi:divalent metal cation transporter [Kamptonema cortianum]|nr:divalent metal cation transporter [Kamptonema cortianum]MDL5050520.1 divalent metal cation transporter [Oscillatoria amoena NRMC-F 0135]
MTAKKFLSILGPGLLMAGAAIGVSHLVQSTRAGADYGLQLIIVVLLSNALKYPFFEIGHRFAVTGSNLLEGYHRMGRGWLYLFLFLNVFTAVISLAGVTFVTGGLAANLLPYGFLKNWDNTLWCALALLICLGLIVVGRYRALEKCMKWLMCILLLCTVAALAAAMIHGPNAAPDFVAPSAWTLAALPFLIALMGWMPAPIEMSVWQSIWVTQKNRMTGHRANARENSIDFNFGYGLTTGLAVVFLLMGAYVMFGTDQSFANQAAGFAAQLVKMYTQTLGGWSGPIVSMAAFAAMFSTTLTVLDAYPHSLATGARIAFPKIRLSDRSLHILLMIVSSIIALVIINRYLQSMRALIDFATTIAFLSAPVFAYMNYRLIFSDITPPELRPGRAYRVFCWIGLVFLSGFSLLFLIWRFFPSLLGA